MAAAYDVIVVGAGPTGLTLAGLLGQRGVRVAVLERFTDIYPLPRAVHLDSEVYRILHSLGVGNAFAQITRPTRGLRMIDRDHRLLAQFQRAAVTDSGLPQGNMFDQPRLEALLRARVAALPAVTLLFGTTVEGVTQDADGATVHARAAGSEVTSTLRGRFLVGCDGANSLVAQVIGADPVDFGFAQRWLVVDVRCARPCGDGWDGVDQVCDPQRAGTFMRVGPERYRWEFQLLDGESSDDYSDIPRLRALIAPWIRDSRDDDLTLLRVAEYVFRGRVAQRWRQQRLLIAGDAAHLTPPFIGQGMGAGIRDAANLSWKLARVCAGSASDALLDTYTTERRRHATVMVRQAIWLGRAMTSGGVIGMLRRWILPWVFRTIPVLGAQVLDSVTPPLRSSLVDRRLPRRVRGHLLPLTQISGGGGDVLVDQALGSGFGIVALPNADVREVATCLAARVVTVSQHRARPLATWLASLRADYAIVRPDRTVLWVGRASQGCPPLPPVLSDEADCGNFPAIGQNRQ